MSLRRRPVTAVDDRRGSVHVIEVMVLGLMVVGAIVAVTQLDQDVARDPTQSSWIEQERARDAMDTLRGLPAQNTSVYHTHRLEELILQHLGGDERTLPELLRSQYSADHRLLLQVGSNYTVVVGPDEVPAGVVPRGDSAFWYSHTGHTLVRPTVSHHGPDMDPGFELLPVWMDRVATPPGHAFEVEAVVSPGDEANRSVVLSHRLPLQGQEPLIVEPIAPGGSVSHVATESEVTNGTQYEWDVRLRISPAGDAGRIWLPVDYAFDVLPPDGWDLNLDEDDWELDSDTADPQWRLGYRGRPMQGEAEAWLNLTLIRPAVETLTHHEVLRVRSVDVAGAEVALVLTPQEVTRPGGVQLVVSQPSPYPVSGEVDLVVTVTNPGDEAISVDRLLVRFDAGHQFKNEPASWSRTLVDGVAVYEYSGGTVQVPANAATTLRLPVKVETTADGDNVRRGMPPVLEYLGPGRLEPPVRDGLLPFDDEPPARMVAGQGASKGTWAARLAVGALADGEHTVRVGHQAEHHVPPGSGRFNVTDSADALLSDLQGVRQGMRLVVPDRTIEPGRPLAVHMELGGLASLLAEHAAGLDGDVVRLDVRAGDLVSFVTGDPVRSVSQEHAISGLADGQRLEMEVPFDRSALTGPVVVDARLVVPTVAHGEVSLNLLGHSVRSASGHAVNPTFFNGHLQFWAGGVLVD